LKVLKNRDGILRICFISNSRKLGGAERVLLETIDVLTENGAECRVLLPGEGTLSEELSRRGILYRIVFSAWLALLPQPNLWQRSKAAVRFGLATLVAMRQIVNGKCDVVYSNTITVGHGALAAKLLNKPHIWHLHEFSSAFHFYFGEGLSCRVIGWLTDVAIVVSKALAASYRPFIAPSKLVPVYPSLHLEIDSLPETEASCTAFPRRDGLFRCTIAGGICPGKGQEDAVRAVALLQEQNVNVELLIVGANENPQYRHKLDQIIQKNRMENIVLFAGEVRDARALIKLSDLLLVCSRSEGFGRVTIEAQLACIPVIGTATNATPELIQEGFNGLLYDADDVAGLAEKILYLYRNPDRARLLGEQGRRSAISVFNKARYASELVGIVNKLTKPLETSAS
jgi:glycosyltransferase involved in cell wall biosynthesis